MDALEPVRDSIDDEERVSPADDLVVAPLQAQRRIMTAIREQFIDRHLVRNLFKRLLGVANRQRDKDGARPRRDLVDVEPEPIRKKRDLRRNCRDRVVVVLTERAQVKLGERINRWNAALAKYPFARFR